jgi:hypothetical protein
VADILLLHKVGALSAGAGSSEDGPRAELVAADRREVWLSGFEGDRMTRDNRTLAVMLITAFVVVIGFMLLSGQM